MNQPSMTINLLIATLTLTSICQSQTLPDAVQSVDSAGSFTPYTRVDNSINYFLNRKPSFNWTTDPNTIHSDGESTKFEVQFKWLSKITVCDGKVSWYTGVSGCGTQACCNTWSPHTWQTGRPTAKNAFKDAVLSPQVFTCSGPFNYPESWTYSNKNAFSAFIPICNVQPVGSVGTYQFATLSEMVGGIVGCYSGGWTGMGGYFPTSGSGSQTCQEVSAYSAGDGAYATEFYYGGSTVRVSDCWSLNSGDRRGNCFAIAGNNGGVGGAGWLWINTELSKRPTTTLFNVALRWNSDRYMFCDNIARLCYARAWLEMNGVMMNKLTVTYAKNGLPAADKIGFTNPVAASLDSLVRSVITAASEMQTQTDELLLFGRVESFATAMYLAGRTNYESPMGDPLVLCDAYADSAFSALFTIGPVRVNMTSIGTKMNCTFSSAAYQLSVNWADISLLSTLGPLAANYTVNNTNLLALLNKLSLSINPFTSLASSILVYVCYGVAAIVTILILAIHLKCYAAPGAQLASTALMLVLAWVSLVTVIPMALAGSGLQW